MEQKRPCYTCKFCSQSNRFLAVHGLCNRPSQDGDSARSVSLAFDVRRAANLCNDGGWFVSRDAPEEEKPKKLYKAFHHTSRIKERAKGV